MLISPGIVRGNRPHFCPHTACVGCCPTGSDFNGCTITLLVPYCESAMSAPVGTSPPPWWNRTLFHALASSLQAECRKAIFIRFQIPLGGLLLVVGVLLLFRNCVYCPSWHGQGRAGTHKWPRVKVQLLVGYSYTWFCWLIGMFWFVPRVSFPWEAALWSPKKSPTCPMP